MNLEAYRISSEPFYQPVSDEIAVFEAAFAERLPVMLKGPTGFAFVLTPRCGRRSRCFPFGLPAFPAADDFVGSSLRFQETRTFRQGT